MPPTRFSKSLFSQNWSPVETKIRCNILPSNLGKPTLKDNVIFASTSRRNLSLKDPRLSNLCIAKEKINDLAS